MKQVILMAAAVVMFAQAGAQDMNDALRKTFLAFDTTRDLGVKQAQANRLGLIAKKWNDEWVTHYYNAYAQTSLAYMVPEPEKKEAYMDVAEEELNKAIELLGEEDDEIHVMKAMVAQGRMAVDPRNRWQQYGKIFEDELRAAKEINEENPRIYYLKGTATYFTPEAFGGGAKKALVYFERAKPFFDAEQQEDMSDPHWGKYANEYFLIQATEKKGGRPDDDVMDEY